MMDNSISASLPLDHGGLVDQPAELFDESVLEASISNRFDAIAHRFASQLAIQDTTVSLTYAELAALVDRIAAATIAATGERAGPVAILLPSDAQFPGAIFGVLAAGRAYIPLNVEFPIEQNCLIVTEVGACAVISSSAWVLEARASLPRHIPIIDVHALPKIAHAKPDTQSDPDDVAAIYHTSGSSGLPKGVAVSHRNLLQWVLLHTSTHEISCADRLLLLASPSVAASFRAIYCALLNGGSLHILPPRAVGIATLLEQIRARGITYYHSVPTLMRRIIESLGPGDRLDSVRIVGLGGDRVQWSDVDTAKRGFSRDVRLTVTFGSTEGGPILHWHVDEALRSSAALPPAGRPWPTLRVTIVGEDGNPVDDGAVGRIVVAGRSVALGYWRGSDLRVRAFPNDPADPKARVFESGDRVRRRPDGLIEFVGRSDQQIKLRGHRIEIEEIEFVLGQCAVVEDAAVVVRRNEFGVPRALAAYVKLSPGVERLRPRDLKMVLKKRVPFYMIPATINMVDQLPRLPNLKIDRTRLVQMDAARVAQIDDPIDSQLIAEVVKAFESVLGDVGATPEDNILSLGGDSLQAVRVAIELEKRFGTAIPPDVFESIQTIRELAWWLQERSSAPSFGA